MKICIYKCCNIVLRKTNYIYLIPPNSLLSTADHNYSCVDKICFQ